MDKKITAIENIRNVILKTFPPGFERSHWLSWLDAFVDAAEELEAQSARIQSPIE
jgi:hypothetical protein